MHRLTRVLVIFALVTALLVLAACASSPGSGGGNTPSASAGSSAVSIKNFSFDPSYIEVKAGSSVTWTNEDSAHHTVTADDGSFNGTADAGQTFSFTFTKAGTYKYHCSIHPAMVAQVVVK